MSQVMTQNDGEFAVVLLNGDGSIADAQPNCTASLGWTREELIGRDVGELLSSGRDALLSQLPEYTDGPEAVANAGHDDTSVSVRVLARRKDLSEFAARVTIRRFTELGCWTLALYSHPSDLESTAPPTVSAQEISLAKKMKENVQEPAPAAARKTSLPFWQNSRLLFSARKKPEPPPQEETLLEQARRMTAPAPSAAPPSAPPVASLETPGADAQRQLEVTAATLARLKGEVERERSERTRAEERAATLAAQVKGLHQQLSESLGFEEGSQKRIAAAEEEARLVREELADCQAALKNEELERKTADEQIAALRELNTHLETSRKLFEEAKKSFEIRRAELEKQLETGRALIKQTEGALEEEMKLRQETARKLSALQREHRDELEARQVRIDQLQAALLEKELRCKALEEDLLRARSVMLDSSR